MLVPLLVLSLVLVNAQAVTSLTSERDVKAIDLLLVTDLTAKEFVFGKLGGVLYNTKEMVLVPMALCGYLWWQTVISGEDLLYLLGGLAVMNLFVAMLGIHSGMSYANSRTAIGVSLGTVFFLFVGIATCMRMMIAFQCRSTGRYNRFWHSCWAAPWDFMRRWARETRRWPSEWRPCCARSPRSGRSPASCCTTR